jgi:hypothetical protein
MSLKQKILEEIEEAKKRLVEKVENLDCEYKNEVELEDERLKITSQLRKHSRPFKPGKANWTFFYDHRHKQIETTLYHTAEVPGGLFFETERIIKMAIGEVGKDKVIKYYFGVGD